MDTINPGKPRRNDFTIEELAIENTEDYIRKQERQRIIKEMEDYTCHYSESSLDVAELINKIKELD